MWIPWGETWTFTQDSVQFSSVQFSSVAQSCPTLCDPMNRSTLGLPVQHQPLEFTKTHVHRVGDAIQPSHPLSSPSPPAPNPSQHQGLFQWVNSSHEVAKVLEFTQDSVQFRSVDQSCPTLCDPMNRSTPGLPVYHQLPEFTGTHVHRVSDATQPYHPLSSPSPPAPNPSQHQSFPMSQLFAWGGQSTGVSALASFLPKKSQGWSPSEWTGWISL